jgi:hypothetical protein
MHFEEMFAKIMDQQKKSMAPMMQRMTAGVKLPDEDRAKMVAIQQKVMDELFDSMSGPEMKAAVADIYRSVFSKEELASQAAFYSTPAGQAMTGKQPQVQEKMMQVMMPKMAEIGPKMQAAMKAFGEEMKAKQGMPPVAPTLTAPPNP